MKRSLLVSAIACVTVMIAAACNPAREFAASEQRIPTGTRTPPSSTTTDATRSPRTNTSPASTQRSNDTTTATPASSSTPTRTPTPAGGIPTQIAPTLDTAEPVGTPSTAVPPAAPVVNFNTDVVNVLLLGRDTSRDANTYRTDVLIVASVDKGAHTVTLLSIPRDLFVYIPGWTMNRINTAAAHGDSIGYGENGIDLLKQTILYNLGLPIHHWVRIDFAGFEAVVDTLGGVEVPVSCALQDWRLRSPELDKQDPDNWEQFLLDAGVHHMDGDLALWYSRTRRSTNDFDRSRRQHQVLRAIFDRALTLNALAQAPELYTQFREFVDTDMSATDGLQFLPVAAQLDGSRIRSRFIGAEHVRAWRTPQGAAVVLPQPELVQALLEETFAPPRTNRLSDAPPPVIIRNGTTDTGLTALAADNLAWAGLSPVVQPADRSDYDATVLHDYTTSSKGSYIGELQRIFGVSDEQVVRSPDPDAEVQYEVVLGADYQPCLHPVQWPGPAPTPEGPPIPAPPVAQVVVHAPFARDEIVVDALFDEWEPFEYISDKPVFGPENWWGPEDAAMEWAVRWNETHLYLALQVSDDAFAQVAAGRDMFRGDGIELLFDMDLAGDALVDELNADDFQIGLSPGDLFNPTSHPEAYLWFPQEEERSVEVVMAFRRVEHESDYQGEIALPWSLLRVTPAVGQEFGFILSLTDNDRPGEQDLQSILSHIEERLVTDPTTWGRLVLDPAPDQ